MIYPKFTGPTVDPDYTIKLDDLYILVKGNKIILRSKFKRFYSKLNDKKSDEAYNY